MNKAIIRASLYYHSLRTDKPFVKFIPSHHLSSPIIPPSSQLMKTMHLAEESSPPEKDKVPVVNCLLLASSSSSSSFAQYSVPLLLFSKPPTSTKFNLQSRVSEAAARLLRHLHHSIVSSAVDTCLRFVRSPLLNNFFSSPTHFRNFFEINLGDCRNTNALRNHNFAAVLPGDSVAGVVVGNGILNFLNIYNTLLIVRLVLTWFPNSPSAIVSPLSTLCDPYLNIFRGIIPPLGGTLDLSPILAFLVLNAFTSAAAALPAELPPIGKCPGHFVPPISSSNLTTSQHKWARRLFGSKIKNSNDDN